MKEIDHWIAFYKNGEKHKGLTEKDFKDLPQFGFQGLLVLYTDGTRQALTGDDYFFFKDDVLGSTNDHAAIIRRFPEVKFGEWLNHKEFEKIQNQIHKLGQEWHAKYHGNKSSTN